MHDIEVPGCRSLQQPLLCRKTAIPPINGSSIRKFPDKEFPQLATEAVEDTLFPIRGLLLACILHPVSVNQHRHPKVDRLPDIQMPILIRADIFLRRIFLAKSFDPCTVRPGSLPPSRQRIL